MWSFRKHMCFPVIQALKLTVAALWDQSGISGLRADIVFSLCDVLAGCCRRPHQTLQRYEKTDNHMLVCTDCPQPPLVRNGRSQEHCARKCKKVKKNFSCRWVMVFFLCFSEAQHRVSSWPCTVPLTPPLLLCIYIFLLFIICSSLNYFLCVSTGLSTFKGTTGNATCFPLTVSPMVCRSRPTSTLLCMKKKVKSIIFKGEVSKNFMDSVFFLQEHFRCQKGFTQADCLFDDCRLRFSCRLLDFVGGFFLLTR